MKNIRRAVYLFAFLADSTSAQTNFIVDQFSANTNSSAGGFVIQSNSPAGQSFTPQFSYVGYVQLSLNGISLSDTGATLSVSLRSDSITGPILGSSDSVTLSSPFGAFPNFIFATPVQVTPGSNYFFEVSVLSGNLWRAARDAYNYPGGTAFFSGVPSSMDLWFREGITQIVPEPSPPALAALGAVLLAVFHFTRRHRSRARV